MKKCLILVLWTLVSACEHEQIARRPTGSASMSTAHPRSKHENDPEYIEGLSRALELGYGEKESQAMGATFNFGYEMGTNEGLQYEIHLSEVDLESGCSSVLVRIFSATNAQVLVEPKLCSQLKSQQFQDATPFGAVFAKGRLTVVKATRNAAPLYADSVVAAYELGYTFGLTAQHERKYSRIRSLKKDLGDGCSWGVSQAASINPEWREVILATQKQCTSVVEDLVQIHLKVMEDWQKRK